MKKYLFIAVFLTIMTKVQAQHDYNTAVGIRLAYGTGIDVKHNLNESTSIEGMVYMQWRGVLITGLYEKRFPLVIHDESFKFYMGGGAHLGFWGDYRRHPWYDESDTQKHIAIGLDGIIGIEYTFKDIPLNLAIDWIPMINIADHPAFWGMGLGLSVRYAIK